MKRVAELVGVKENYLARAVRSGGVAPCQTVVQARVAAVHRRFYAAMALHDLANEVPLPEVVRKYGCTRGVLQSLQQSAATFSGNRKVLCKFRFFSCFLGIYICMTYVHCSPRHSLFQYIHQESRSKMYCSF